jgi:hypothetical protein
MMKRPEKEKTKRKKTNGSALKARVVARVTVIPMPRDDFYDSAAWLKRPIGYMPTSAGTGE